MIDHIDKAHLLSIDNSWAYIDKNSPSLEELTSNIHVVKEDKILKKRPAMGKYKDKGPRFDSSKVKM